MPTKTDIPNSNGKFLSPLRYPGSKRRLSKYIINALEINNLQPKLLIEPFAGGANVGLKLLMNNLVDQIIFMDIDPLIAHFWDAVFFDTDWLINEIFNIEISVDMFQEFKYKKPRNKREYAIKCLFLNRTSFSGILRPEVGPLGGKDQKSPYKIDCRFPKEKIISRIERIANHKQKVFGVWACDWKEGIHRLRQEQKTKNLPSKDVFFYLDPPFFKKANKLYRYFFEVDDHIELRDFLLNLNDAWILSYDFADEVDLLYGSYIKDKDNGTSKKFVEMNYSTASEQKRKPVQEMIISNLDRLPESQPR